MNNFKFKEFINLLDEITENKRKWEFKWIPVSLILYKYVSESFEEFIRTKIKDSNLNWGKEQNDSEWIKEIKKKSGFFNKLGYFINPSEMFPENINDKNLNEIFENNLKSIEINSLQISPNSPLKNIFNNSLIEQIHIHKNHLKKISNWINKNITKLNYKEICGELFEYLIEYYWLKENSSKSCFTPENIASLLTQIIDHKDEKRTCVYDPACKVGNILTKLSKFKKNFYYFGEEIDEEFNKLCKINLILHNISYKNFQIKANICLSQNLLSSNQKFDIIVSNFFNLNKSWIYLDNGKSLSTKKTWKLIDHCIEALNDNGIASILCNEFIIDTNSSNEKYRKDLIDKKYLDTVIKLPTKFLKNTSETGSILIFKKNKSDPKVMMIQANRLDNEELEEIKELLKTRNNSKISKLIDPSENEHHSIFPEDYFFEQPRKRNRINEEEIKQKINLEIREWQKLNKKINRRTKLNLSNYHHRTYTIGEVFKENGEILCGKLKKEKTNNEEGYPAINREDIKNLKPSFNKCIKFTNRNLIIDKTEVVCKYGDILISTKAKNEKGNAAIYLGEENPLIGIGITIIRTNENQKKDLINSKYLVYFFQSEKFHKEIEMTGEQLDRNEIKKVKIPLPPLDIQRKIVNYLDIQMQEINIMRSIIENKKQLLNYEIDRIMNNENTKSTRKYMNILKDIFKKNKFNEYT